MHKHPITIIIAALGFILIGYWFAARTQVDTIPPQPQGAETAETAQISEADARAIAEAFCIMGDESLASGYRNENTNTWWFDANLFSVPQGCNPACVVSEDTRQAEINWRCTGVLQPGESDRQVVTNFAECVAAGYPVLASNPRQCTAEATTFIEQQQREDESSERVACAPSQRGADVCVQIYDPVCADVQVECIKAPCPPIAQTFGNACEACRNARVSSYVRGACETK